HRHGRRGSHSLEGDRERAGVGTGAAGRRPKRAGRRAAGLRRRGPADLVTEPAPPKALDASDRRQTTDDSDRAITQSLRAHVLRGLGWNAGVVVVMQVSRLASGLVMVRLLAPHD